MSEYEASLTVRMSGILTRQGSAQILAAVKNKKLKGYRGSKGGRGWKISSEELRKYASKVLVGVEREQFEDRLDSHLEVLHHQFLKETARKASAAKVDSGASS